MKDFWKSVKIWQSYSQKSTPPFFWDTVYSDVMLSTYIVYNLYVWIRSRMPMTSRDQLTVEKTPSYFVSASVAQRVYNMSRDIRLLVVVRDPVTRALSDFTQAQFKRRRRRQSFHPDVNLDTDRRSSFERRAFIDAEHNVIDTSWSAIDIGLYERHARHWLEVFPRQQIHFVDGEQLITDPAAQLFNVQTFLGLPPLITERNFYFNKTKGFPCLVRRPRTSDESVHCLGKTKGRTHPTVYVEVLKKLRDFYRPYNAKFYELTGDNFGWEWVTLIRNFHFWILMFGRVPYNNTYPSLAVFR